MAATIRRLADTAPNLWRILKRSVILTPARFAVPEVRFQTIKLAARDGVLLATNIYLSPALFAPTIAWQGQR